MNEQDEYIRRAIVLAGDMKSLADEGEMKALDAGCAVLFGVVRDCAYRIQGRAEREAESHLAIGACKEDVAGASGPGARERRQNGDKIMNMKVAISTTAVVLAMAAMNVVAADNWGNDFEAARKAAAEGKRVIVANFTGSDWCPWCMKLDSEIFKNEAFKNFAKDNLVLFVADFPNEKVVAKEIAAQNRKLAEKYGVEGFPTILLLDASGKELARTGYRRGGAEAYVDHLKTLMEKPKAK